ncbi:MAG TPA: 30S ribosomal protein S11 [Vampirovibrionales bacterium]
MAVGSKKRKAKQKVAHGLVCIKSSFNNTLITITDPNGDTLAWSSAGACGFKGSRKGTPFASQSAAAKAAKEAYTTYGMRSASIFIDGPGAGRESAIRALQAAGIEVISIRDITSLPHNGCRPPKRRRV